MRDGPPQTGQSILGFGWNVDPRTPLDFSSRTVFSTADGERADVKFSRRVMPG